MSNIRVSVDVDVDDVLDELATRDLVKEVRLRARGGDAEAVALAAYGDRVVDDLLTEMETTAGTDRVHFGVLMARLRTRLGLGPAIVIRPEPARPEVTQ